MKRKKPVKPPQRKRAPSQQLTYRPRREQDDAFLKQVTIAQMKEVYEQSTGTPLTEQGVAVLLELSDTTMIIEQQGRPIGYYSYLIPGPGRLYIGSLIFTANAQGKGHGASVCRRIEEDARRLGVHTIDLHVQVTNQKAVRFWTVNGYRITVPPVAGSYLREKQI